MMNSFLCAVGLTLAAFARNILPEFAIAISLTFLHYSQVLVMYCC